MKPPPAGASGTFPDAEEDSEEWYDAAQEYGWYQDWMEEAAEQHYFEASLASIPDRLENAKDELQELEQLLQIAQPGIVLRMAFVQVVTVMDSFLMYSARALLNHEPHLNRFMQQATLLVADGVEYLSRHTGKPCLAIWSDKEDGDGILSTASVTPLSQYEHRGRTARQILKADCNIRIAG